MNFYRCAIRALLFGGCFLGVTGFAQPKSAVITFSGLFNKPGGKALQRGIPDSYQPLLSPSPDTKPIDGGDLGVRISWTNCAASSSGANSIVKDHTQDFNPEQKELGGAVGFSQKEFSITFSVPVEIPSFCWTRFGGTKQEVRGSASVYTNATDTKPAKTVPLIYVEDRGYQWAVEEGFKGMKISKITFQNWDQPAGTPNGPHPINIDDLMIVLP